MSSTFLPCALAASLALACGSAGGGGDPDGGGGAGSSPSGGAAGSAGSAGGRPGRGGSAGSGGSAGASGGSAGSAGSGGSGGSAGSGGSSGASGGSAGLGDAGADAGCSPGAKESVACGKCGTKERSCSASGQWEAFGPCSAETGVCEPGQQATLPCGNCNLGTRSDYCTTSCQWLAGPCTGVPKTACKPGDVKAGPTACASAGEIHASTCQSDCSWGAPSATCSTPPSGWRFMSPLQGFVFVGDQVRTAVWSGKEMLIWGRQNGGSTAVRAGYAPGTDTWRALALDPLGPRIGEIGVWTGSRFLVWGGASIYSNQSQCNADGALYDPVANAWEKVPAPSNQEPPKCRNWAVAVWSPETEEVLIWGGASSIGYLADGDAYKPATKTWRALPAAPIAAREQAEGFYSGGKLHVFGGLAPGYLADGASFDPVTNTWTKLPATPGLAPRVRHLAKGEASGGAFWGGVGAKYYADGLAFDAQSGSFSAIPAPPAGVVPNAPRAFAGGWFAQGKLWFWGGKGTKPGDQAWFDDGALFDLASKTWTAIPSGGPSPRESPLVVWTGSEAIVFGGWVVGASGYDGRIYRP